MDRNAKTTGNPDPPATIPALFLHAAATYDKDDAFRYKSRGQYVSVSHRSALEMVKRATYAILALGFAKGDRVAILSENRFEWAVADLAILSAGCVVVPIYATLPPAQAEHILRDSEALAVFVSNERQFDKIRDLRPRLPLIRHVYSFDRILEHDVDTLGDLVTRGSSLAGGWSYEEQIAKVRPGDWASIVYTSGATGDPKGAVLSHGNIVSNVAACLKVLSLGSDDRCLSFLPLSHVLERTAGYYTMLSRGVTIAYAESFATVLKNIDEVSPTVMVSVPLIYEKLHSRILGSASSGSATRRRLFSWAYDVGKAYAEVSTRRSAGPLLRAKYGVGRALVFRKITSRFGGRLRFFISGGAPLRRDVAQFFYGLGVPILEGYGLTETSPVVAVNSLEHFKFGTVGKPIPGVDVRIADDGEILVKGPNVMQGYFNQPGRTREVIREGWFHTGDIGHLDDEGFLVITDRKKDIIVTAGGKNVAPQPIESALHTSEYILRAVLVGNNRQFISAIIVPDFEKLKAFAEVSGVPYRSESDLVRDPKIIQKIDEEIARRTEHLAVFERVRKFILADRDFSVEKNELTATLKIRRTTIENAFREQIDALYSN